MSEPGGKSTQYRKRVKHYHDPGHCHELTFSCYDRRPLLDDDIFRSLLSQAINRAVANHHFRLAAFVYMPEHVHLLVYSAEKTYRIDRLLYAVKRPTSYRIKQHLAERGSPLLVELTVHERPGKTAFRFWQKGPGYDRNLTNADAVLASINYINLNSVRRGLVNKATDWRWSSSRYYDDPSIAADVLLPTIHGLPPEALDDSIADR